MKAIQFFCVLLIFETYFYTSVEAWRTFYRGHRVGGNLQPPEDFQPRADVSTKHFDQTMDHFNPIDTRTWSQRYYVNEEFFNATQRNVAFLMIGGEGPASIGWMTSGAWYDTAKKYGAIMFQLEHRFYGTSQPYSDISTQSMLLLSSEQAIEDLSSFIVAMNEEYNLSDDVKWIAFGGSYSGSLAAWLRQKYPHLVAGAMSASGPLLALLDYHEYLQVVVDDLATHSQECVDNLQKAYQQLDALVSNKSTEYINNAFKLCDSIEDSYDNAKDLANLYEVIADNFAYIAQYNKNRGDNVTTTDTLCDILTDNTPATELLRLAAVNTLILSKTGEECLDYKYEKMIAQYQNVTLNEDMNMRQWYYQTCTEFGFYQTSSQKTQVFGDKFPIDFFTQQCVDLFGAVFNETLTNLTIKFTNKYYGAKDIKVSNVVFVHGTFDPWYPLGITETKDEAAPAIFINGTAHCANMYSSSENDIEELIAAREEVERLIGVWLGNVGTSGTSRIILGQIGALFSVFGALILSSFFK